MSSCWRPGLFFGITVLMLALTYVDFGELCQGPWQGLAESEVALRWPLEWSACRTAPQTLDLDGRETLAALYALVADALDDLVIRYRDCIRVHP